MLIKSNKFVLVIVLQVLFSATILSAQTHNKKRNLDVYGIMMITPDSLLSKDLRVTKHQLIFCFYNSTDLINGKLVFDQNKKYRFIIPKLYIEKMLKNIDELNSWTDTISRNIYMNSFNKIKKLELTRLSNIDE